MDDKARKKYKDGQKALERKFGLGNKTKAALKCFLKAAELFDAGNNPTTELPDAEERVAFCYEKLGDHQKAVDFYVKAGGNYLSVANNSVSKILGESSNINESITKQGFHCLEKAGEMYALNGKYFAAGKAEKQIGEYLIEEINNTEKEIDVEKDRLEIGEEKEKHQKKLDELNTKKKKKMDLCFKHYTQATNYFELANSIGFLNNTMEEMGNYAAEYGDFEKAVKFYKKLLNAKWNEGNNNTGSKGKIHFRKGVIMTNILLCQLANIDTDAPEESLLEIKEQMEDFVFEKKNFKESSEYILINNICVAFENQEMKKFKKAVKVYSKTHKPKDFMIACLEKVKSRLEALLNEDESNL